MLKIAICDDDPDAITKYAELINDIAKKNHIEIELSYFFSGESLLAYCAGAPDALDIVYLDIVMDKTDGLDTARKLQESGSHTLIVFLTNYDEYVFEAFDVKAANYLLKDNLELEKFTKVFLAVVDLASAKEKQLFSYMFDGKTKIVALDEIAYFEIWNKRVTIHYMDKKTDTYYESMERLALRLGGKYFIRTHRSYLVNLPYISMFRKDGLYLKTEEIVPIGGTYRSSIKKALSAYISRHNLYSLDLPDNEEGER